MSWADDQIRKERNEQESTKISDELRAWDHRVKDEVGKGCFDAVKNYVKAETEKYNKAQQNQASGIFFLPDSSAEEEGDINVADSELHYFPKRSTPCSPLREVLTASTCALMEVREFRWIL